MQYTDNYSLKKPERGVEPHANIDDLNYNTDVIDGALADDRQISLPMYDSTQSYNTGDIRGYENPTTHRIRAYRCLEDNVTGPWDATKWAQTTLADEIGTGGGASSLADLTDTDITSPTNGQTLKYNSTSGKWENASGGAVSDLDDLGDVDITTPSDGDLLTYDAQNDEWVNAPASVPDLGDLGDVTLTTPTEGQILTYDGDEWVNTDAPDVDVTKTATGNPIEISDGANAPLVKCVTQITGYQQGSGTPSPDNIRPIVAYTEGEIEVRGKNLFKASDFDLVAGSNITVVNDNEMTIQSRSSQENYNEYVTNNSDIWNIQFDAETLTVTGSASVGLWISANGNVSKIINISLGTVGTKTHYSANIPANSEKIFLGGWAYSGSIELTNIQIEKGSTATDYEPYTSTTHTTTYPSAIYRGSEDVVNGEVKGNLIKRVISASEIFNSGTSYTGVTYFSFPKSLNSASYNSYYSETLICSHAVNGNATSLNNGVGRVRSDANKYNYMIGMPEGITDSDAKAILDGMELVYENSTPTSSVTPTNLPIRTLSGYSHIESSTGEMEIEYITGKYQPLVDLISESSGGDSYRETTLWENASGTHGQITLSDNLSNYDAICVIMAPNNEPTYRSSQIIPVSAIDTTGATHFGIFVSGATSYCSSMTYVDDTHISCDSWASNYPMLYFKVAGIKYGGSSQQTVTLTRSLSKNTEKTSLEPISEPLETKTDSLSKDEAELKEEDESKEKEEVTEEPEEEPTEEEPEIGGVEEPEEQEGTDER